jgi:glutamine amidotransferase
MCRWLAYAGEPLHPSTLILETKHSLVAQALNSPLGIVTVNGDGFGLGWYAKDAVDATVPALFHSIEPAWYDENLHELAQAIQSPLFFAHVRAAAGPPIQQTNCHPFRHGHWLFMHNGALEHFPRMRRDLLLGVDPELFPGIKGTTDSEVLFHLALTFGLQEDPVRGLGRAIGFVEEVAARHGIADAVLGTFAVSDGHTLWALRYSTARNSPTLFHSVAMPELRQMYPDLEELRRFGARSRVVVSEPLTDLPGAFVEVPESTVVILDAEDFRTESFVAHA